LKPKILVVGASGQVGMALQQILAERGIFLTRSQLDLSKPNTINDILDRYDFEVLINAAAYTQVDKAQIESDLAYLINAQAVEILAVYCQKNHKVLIHYSTDYVFNCQHQDPITEMEPTNPLSVYGKSKLLGEQEIIKHQGRYLIFRTSWVYDAHGKNFLNTMLKLGAQKETLSIVADQFGAPTYAFDLAHATLGALEEALKLAPFPSGIYHLVNQGCTTWYDFAKEIFNLARTYQALLLLKNLHAIPTSSYPTPATRPLNSRLCCDKITKVLNITMPTWQDGLVRCFTEKFSLERR
jgi:dTDP-4-dehydrorhamnose reductase